MHVVVISDYAHVNGGASKVAVESAVSLAAHGASVTFLYAIGPVDERLNHRGIALAHVPLDSVRDQANPVHAARLAVWNEGARTGVLAALNSIVGRDTVVHVHQWSRALGPAMFGALGELNVPVVVSLHDYFPVCPNGAYYHFSNATPCTLKPMGAGCLASGCDRESRRHKVVRLLRHRRLWQQLAKIKVLTFVHVSDMAHELAKPFSPAHVKHMTVWNPVPAMTGPQAVPWANEHVLFAGRMSPEKGVFGLAEMARQRSVPCAFLGEGPLDDALQDQYPEHRYVPWGDRNTVGEALRACRALVLPALWHETFGLVVLEALSLGVPVIISDTVGAGAFVFDDVNGYVVERNNLQQLGDRLERCMDHDTLRRLSNGARTKTPISYLTEEAHMVALERVYSNAVERGGLGVSGDLAQQTA